VAFSDDEVRQLAQLLMRFADEEMDQHETWRWESRYGPVFVRMTRALPEGESEETYDPIDPFGTS
jgi:hypothetical protein